MTPHERREAVNQRERGELLNGIDRTYNIRSMMVPGVAG